MSKIAKDPRMIKTHFEGVTKYLINGFTFEPEKFHEYKDFVQEVVTHCVIPLENVDEFIDKVFSYADLGPQVRICISSDTQINIFDDNIMEKYRQSWMKATLALVRQLSDRNNWHGFDHCFPMCFFTQEMLDTYHSKDMGSFAHNRTHCCSEFGLGLIDWNFDLHFCNQTRFKIGNLLDENGNMIPLYKIKEMIKTAPQVKVENIKKLSEKCKDCSALPCCKVGCYYNVLQ